MPSKSAHPISKAEANLIKSAAKSLEKISDMLQKAGYPMDKHPPNKIVLKHGTPPFSKKADQRIAAVDPGPHHPSPHKRRKKKP